MVRYQFTFHVSHHATHMEQQFEPFASRPELQVSESPKAATLDKGHSIQASPEVDTRVLAGLCALSAKGECTVGPLLDAVLVYIVFL